MSTFRQHAVCSWLSSLPQPLAANMQPFCPSLSFPNFHPQSKLHYSLTLPNILVRVALWEPQTLVWRFCGLKFWEKLIVTNKAKESTIPSKPFQLLLSAVECVVTIRDDPTAPFNSWTLDQSLNLFSSLSLLVKAMRCGYFWFFLFNYISPCLLWSELIDLFSWGVASVLLRCWIIILCMLVWSAKSYRMSNVQGKNRWCMDIRNSHAAL